MNIESEERRSRMFGSIPSIIRRSIQLFIYQLPAAFCFILVLSGCAVPGTEQPVATPIQIIAPVEERQLVFYNWEDDIPQEVFADFTLETGIKVEYRTYSAQDEAVANIRAGAIYDLVVLDNQNIPPLIRENRLTVINHANITNFKNISPEFRDLAYDPGNRFSIPYTWGTIGVGVRPDLIPQPITSWVDLWNPAVAGRIGMWSDEPRLMLSIALKSLGYSANSENRPEVEQAAQRLIDLKPGMILLDTEGKDSPVADLVSGRTVASIAWPEEVKEAQLSNGAVQYVFPREGAIFWGDNFVIPANSTKQADAELLINYLLRGEVSARIINYNEYANANVAARATVDPALLNDPLTFPSADLLLNAEPLLPLTEAGEALYAEMWGRFEATGP